MRSLDDASLPPAAPSRRAHDPAGESYYGLPVLNEPVWKADIPAYLFLGGLAGGSSLLAAGAQLSGQQGLARSAKAGAAGAIGLSLAALIHDLGRPSRFLNMLRVFKPTSPMSVGTWILSAYAPAAFSAALSDVTGAAPAIGTTATASAALLGPAVAAYTSALIANTAVPAWHDGHREMPFVFVGSAAVAASGWALLTAPAAESGAARRLAAIGAVAELTASHALEHRLGTVGDVYKRGTAGRLMRTSKLLTTAGALASLLAGPRGRRAAGAGLLAASACTRFAIFQAGLASARDPADTLAPQRTRAGAEQRCAVRDAATS